MKKSLLFLSLIVTFTCVIYFGLEALDSRNKIIPVYGPDNHRVPEFSFINQLGDTIHSEELSDKIWIVNYFFTSCPTICPKMTHNVQSVHEQIRNNSGIQIMSFTVDPKRDVPERLLSFADKYRVNHKSWFFLTGSKEELYRLGNRGFLLASADPGEVDDLDFIHSENIVLVDLKRRIRGNYNGLNPGEMKKLISDINKLGKTGV